MTADDTFGAFLEWQKHGQGWRTWPVPVDLEPPFSPFQVQDLRRQYDDGLRPSFFQRLFSAPRNEVETILDNRVDDAVPEMFYEDEDEIAEFQIYLPETFVTGITETEQFLTQLRNVAYPVAFELIGTHAGITVQFACRPSDAPTLRRALGSFFPDVVVLQEDSALFAACVSGGEKLVIVDLGLSESTFRPLAEPHGYTVDPLTGVIGVMSALRRCEVGVVQVLFHPVRYDWASALLHSVEAIEDPDSLRFAKQKTANPLFSVAIRVLAQAPDGLAAFETAKALGHSLIGASATSVNELIALNNGGYDGKDHESDIMRRQTHRSGMILSARELLTFAHLPSASIRSEQLRRLIHKTRAAPEEALGNELRLGVNQHRGKESVATLSPDQRLRHTYVIGASGTGKSTLLLNLVIQDIEHGHGLAVLDPHGDLIDDIIANLPESRLDDVILLDPSDSDYPIGLNILEATSETETNLLSSDLVAVFRRLSTSWGDQMDAVFGNAILAFLSSKRGGTLLDLRRFLIDAAFRRDFLTSVEDPEVVYYWQKAFTLLKGNAQAPIVTRLDTFLRPKLIRYMVAQKQGKLSFGRVMDESKILLAKLSQGAIGEENSHLLGSLLVTKFNQAALARQATRRDDRRPFFLYLDEFQKFITPSLADLLTGARKYGLGVTLAHQDLTQSEGKNREVASAAASTYTRIFFRTNESDARKLAAELSYFEAKDILNLGTGDAIVRLERSANDFNLETDSPPYPERDQIAWRREVVQYNTRDTYAMPREEVEASLIYIEEEAPLRPKAAASPGAERAAERERPAKTTNSSEAERTPARESPQCVSPVVVSAHTSGRGGAQHKYLQTLIQKWGEASGYKTSIEEQVLGGVGIVDVSLTLGERRIACEISVTTSVEHELGNIHKCIAAGFDPVIWISPDAEARRKAIASLAKEPENIQKRVQVISPDALFDALERVAAPATPQASTIRGYKVRVANAAGHADDRAAKKDLLLRIIAKSMGKVGKL